MIARHPGACRPHAFQDATYGRNARVMNPVASGKSEQGYRCTVCAPPKEANKKRGGIYLLSQLAVVRK